MGNWALGIGLAVRWGASRVAPFPDLSGLLSGSADSHAPAVIGHRFGFIPITHYPLPIPHYPPGYIFSQQSSPHLIYI